jgi:16S rRNA (adenine1518-N6/adenine1519-N6)-dimethyltransferase
MTEDKYFEKIKEYKLLAKHEVGQNFLCDPVVSKEIVDMALLKKEDRVLEIGCGAGSLSYFIAKADSQADLIDIDEGLITKLQGDFAGISSVHPLMANVMRFDLSPYEKIIGNLPYYITSAIIEKILLEASDAKKAVLMVQKEALTRLTSSIGSPDYGPLPILLKYRCHLNKGFIVPRTSFVPAPHVDSIVFSLDFLDNAKLSEAKNLYSLASKLFIHRRKTILNNLGPVVGDVAVAKSILGKANIDPQARPEDLSVDNYLSLVHQLY